MVAERDGLGNKAKLGVMFKSEAEYSPIYLEPCCIAKLVSGMVEASWSSLA